MPARRTPSSQHKTHRLPAGAVEAMLARQGGACLICRKPLPPFVVDHDHELARRDGHDPAHGCPRCVRGLLCPGCNTLLGNAKDDPAILRRAAAYVELGRGAHS